MLPVLNVAWWSGSTTLEKHDLVKRALMSPIRKNNFAKRFLLFIAVIGLSGVVAALATSHYIRSQGGLAEMVSTSLSSNGLDIQVQIGDAGFQRNGTQSIDLLLKDIVVNKDDHQISVPEALLRFGWHSLYLFSPEKIIIQSSDIVLYKDNTGLEVEGETGWFANQFKQAFQSPTSLAAFPFWLQGVAEFTVTGNKLSLFDKASPHRSPSQWSDVSVTITPELKNDSQQLSLKAIAIENIEGRQKGQLRVALDTDLLSSLNRFDVKLDKVSVQSMEIFAAFPDSIEITKNTQISGQFSGMLDGLEVHNLKADMQAQDIAVNLPASDEITEITELSAVLDFSAKDRLLIVKEANVKFEDDRKLQFAGQFYGVGLPDISFDGNVFAQDIPIEQVRHYAQRYSSSAALTALESSISGGRFQTITAELSGMLTGWQQPSGLAIHLSDVKMTGDFVNLRVDYQQEQYQQLVGTLKGKVEIDVSTPKSIDRILIAMEMQDARLRVASFPDIIRIPSADAVLRVTPEKMVLKSFEVNTDKYGSLAVQAERADGKAGVVTHLTAATPYLDAGLFAAMWPKQLAVNSRNFVTRKFQSGKIENAKIVMQIQERDKPKITQLSGHLDYLEGEFDWLSGMPPMRISKSYIQFLDNALIVTSDHSNAGGITVSGAEIRIAPLLRPSDVNQRLDLTIRGRGNQHTILQLLDHPKVNQMEKLGLKKLEPQADMDFRFTAFADVKPQTPLKLKDITIGAELVNASFRNLPLGFDLTNGSLELSVQDDIIQLSGAAELDEMPTQFSFLAEPNGTIQLDAEIAPHQGLQEWLSAFLPVKFANRLGASISLSGNLKEKNYIADISSDLNPVSVYVDELEWGKLSGEEGGFKGRVSVTQNVLSKIDVFTLNGAGLEAKGRVLFNHQGKLQDVFVEEFSMPGTQLSSLIVERQSEAGFRLFAEGRRIDISHVTDFAQGGTHPAFSFDVTADEIKLGDGLKVSGNIVGSKKPGEPGEAMLQGTVTTDGVTRFDQASLRIGFDAGKYDVKGSALIGGGEALVKYQTLRNGDRQLYILSKNAGRVLDGLSITDAIKDGELELKTVFSGQDRTSAETTIVLDDFKLVKGAKAVRVYAVLSPTGLFSLFEGEGTFFNKGEAIITSRNGVHDITKLRATGASVGLGLVGTYDSNSKTVDVSGNLVPINILSDVIGLVPLVGEILTGIDKSGLLVTQFSVTGEVDDLDVSVNPVTLLIPGVLRDLFSPNWLESEAERIFNDSPSSQ